MTSRELVKLTLEFKNTGGRVPVDLWTLPWAETHYPKELKELRADYHNFDIVQFPDSKKIYKTPLITKGDMYAEGQFTDEWGVEWKSIHAGIVGEVKTPIVPAEDENWEDTSLVHFPEELLTIDVDAINAFCASTSQFVLSSDLVRTFERLQFIRGTENLFCDIALENKGMLKMLARIHDFNCRLFELWGTTDVDGLFMMDDWGTQRNLLINPEAWRKYFKPLYKEYAEIAHKHGKKLFFHSDGYTLEIIPDLIEIGFDAVNSQIFCMGIDKLARFKGQITFWGEMDRQHKLVSGTPKEIDDAVKEVFAALWADGGVIGQCEFGAGANPALVAQLYRAWGRVK